MAALLPLGVGMMTVLGTFLVMRGIHAVLPMSIFALNLIIGLGLGLAIDYSLFVVSRFREELERHGETAPALRRTMATAGRTVLFSAVTVAAALASLVVFPQRFLYSMGLGGAAVALVAARRVAHRAAGAARRARPACERSQPEAVARRAPAGRGRASAPASGTASRSG